VGFDPTQCPHGFINRWRKASFSPACHVCHSAMSYLAITLRERNMSDPVLPRPGRGTRTPSLLFPKQADCQFSYTQITGAYRSPIRRIGYHDFLSGKPMSGRLDLNQRPPLSESGRLPDCPTPRLNPNTPLMCLISFCNHSRSTGSRFPARCCVGNLHQRSCWLVENKGLEPFAFCLQSRCST
jgi:hypothetical protein